MVLLANGFPRLNMCASTIFVVGTSGIPPKLNYRSVKSYKSIFARRSPTPPLCIIEMLQLSDLFVRKHFSLYSRKCFIDNRVTYKIYTFSSRLKKLAAPGIRFVAFVSFNGINYQRTCISESLAGIIVIVSEEDGCNVCVFTLFPR